MDILYTVLIIIASVAVGALLILFLLAAVCYHFAFGKRADKNELLKYFTADDFFLRAKKISAFDENGILTGYVYTEDNGAEKDGVVVFCHGMGPGQIAYTTEIAFFCKLGYPVLALDSRGCNLSDGKGLRGMYEGVKTAVTAVNCARAEFPDKKIFIVGHSWGAYSALCASALEKVDKVVAVSAPDTPVKALKEGASKFIPAWLAAALCPFWRVIQFFKFGKRGNTGAVESAQKSGAETLLVHGGKDTVVAPLNAAYYGTYGENVTKYLAKDKAHNPYNTVAAEEKLKELNLALACAGRNENTEEYFRNFDYAAATEEDEEVMCAIAQFLEK